MPSQSSALATAQANALVKGPVVGSNGIATPSNLKVLSEKIALAVGVLTTAEFIRFGIVPKGARIIPNMSLISSNHSATVAGKLVFVPVDGTGSNQEITGVVANLEATETTSIPDVADDLTVAEDSWVQFMPGADTTIASTAKDFRLRLAYAIP
jgi:hypothetical protein